MSRKFNQSFRSAVIEKALSRSRDVTMNDIAKEYGISRATIDRWIREAQLTESISPATMKDEEKRPQDWSKAERLQAIIECANMEESEVSAYCRGKGLYPHHIKQWKADFAGDVTAVTSQQDRTHVKQLKAENKDLKRELQRKEKALAETAALLVLKKKVQHLLDDGEDN